MMTHTKPFIGWPLLPLPDAEGNLSYPSLETSVRQTMQLILQTRPGEQLMRPTFGAGLENYIHQPNDLTTRRRIHDDIVDALAKWEPRIGLERVEVYEMEDEPDHIRIEIVYRLQRTGSIQQLGLTMILE